MAGVGAQPERLLPLLVRLQRVEAEPGVGAPGSPVRPGVARVVEDVLLRVDGVEVPLEGPALLVLLELEPLGHVANVHREQVRAVHVEEALVVAHPDLHGAGGVDAVGVLEWERRGNLVSPRFSNA